MSNEALGGGGMCGFTTALRPAPSQLISCLQDFLTSSLQMTSCPSLLSMLKTSYVPFIPDLCSAGFSLLSSSSHAPAFPNPQPKMPANGSPPLKLQFGLINHEGRYLTAETFGFKVQITLAKMLTEVLTVVVKRRLSPRGNISRCHR